MPFRKNLNISSSLQQKKLSSSYKNYKRTRVISRVTTFFYHYLTIMTSTGTIIPWCYNGHSRSNLMHRPRSDSSKDHLQLAFCCPFSPNKNSLQTYSQAYSSLHKIIFEFILNIVSSYFLSVNIFINFLHFLFLQTDIIFRQEISISYFQQSVEIFTTYFYFNLCMNLPKEITVVIVSLMQN